MTFLCDCNTVQGGMVVGWRGWGGGGEEKQPPLQFNLKVGWKILLNLVCHTKTQILQFTCNISTRKSQNWTLTALLIFSHLLRRDAQFVYMLAKHGDPLVEGFCQWPGLSHGSHQQNHCVFEVLFCQRILEQPSVGLVTIQYPHIQSSLLCQTMNQFKTVQKQIYSLSVTLHY